MSPEKKLSRKLNFVPMKIGRLLQQTEVVLNSKKVNSLGVKAFDNNYFERSPFKKLNMVNK